MRTGSSFGEWMGWMCCPLRLVVVSECTGCERGCSGIFCKGISEVCTGDRSVSSSGECEGKFSDWFPWGDWGSF
jgi:hypothetical protein